MTFIKENPVVMGVGILVALVLTSFLLAALGPIFAMVKLILMVIGGFTVIKWVTGSRG